MKRARTFLLTLIFVTSGFTASTQTLQTLASFSITNGAYPLAGMTLGNDGNYYGTTVRGGSTNFSYPYGCGTVFRVTTNGTLTTLASFSFTNGLYPQAALTLGNDGNFYGTTQYGGSTNSANPSPSGMGTIFQVTTNGTLTTLVLFNSTNGANPQAALTLGNDHSFYGTTMGGGSSGYGTVFKVTTNGTLTTLHTFGLNDPMDTNGMMPSYPLTIGSDGNFYGTTSRGGYNDNGTLFQVTTNGTFTTLAFFPYQSGGASAKLTIGSDGNFYGTIAYGSEDIGAVFQMTTNGTFTTLVSFNVTNGESPSGGLTLGTDSNYYGTTGGGGSGGYGTIFRVTTNGTLTTFYSFTDGPDGEYPSSGLTLDNNGNFYGTTIGGGITNSTYPGGMGTVFRLLLSPVIFVQPRSQTNNAGATVTFLVSATSLNPMSFQWQKNSTNLVDGGNLSGANSNSLTITGISDSDAAVYSVIVSNANGSVTSSNAMLTVDDLPSVATQPLSRTVGVGNNVTLKVAAYGAPPFVFRWYYNNSPIGSPASGTNVSSYTLTNVQTNQSGNYSVLVINGYGSVTSSNAVLTVLVPPMLKLQFAVGCPQLNLAGTLGEPFVVQYSTNLANTNWVNLLSLTNLSSSPYEFLDTAGAGQPERFYRAIMR